MMRYGLKDFVFDRNTWSLKRPRRAGVRRGFVMVTEMITALCIVALLVTVLSISLGAERRADRRLGDQLTALRTAESVLGQLQKNPEAKGFASNIHIAPAGSGWTRVTVVLNTSSASLVGPTKGAP